LAFPRGIIYFVSMGIGTVHFIDGGGGRHAMLTKTKNLLNVPADIEEVEYPPEVVEKLDRQFEIAKLKIATGELVPQTVEELAAELGIDFDDGDDCYEDD
jgi:hypothetical protein